MRNNQRIFIVLFTFFTVVALGSILILSTKGSVFNRNRNSFGAQPAVLDNTTIIAGDSATAESSEEAAAEPTPVETPAAESSVEEAPVAESSVEEAPVEEPVEETPAPEIKYYTFSVSTESTALNLRKAPSLYAGIIAKLPKKTTGYVLRPGSEWSYIRTEDGAIGYSSNDYLVITKVSEEDFPEDIRGSVEAPTEDLPSDIFGE